MNIGATSSAAIRRWGDAHVEDAKRGRNDPAPVRAGASALSRLIRGDSASDRFTGASSPNIAGMISAPAAGRTRALARPATSGRPPCDSAAQHDSSGFTRLTPRQPRSQHAPASSTACASASPAAAASATCLAVTAPASPPARARSTPPASGSAASRIIALRAIARPQASASRQPALPQSHAAPSGRTSMWPISPAMPSAPPQMRPPSTHPPPMPVLTVT
jgi:hypothetical protein